MAVVGIGDTLDVVGKIPWCQTVQASVNEHSQLEIDAFRRPQPVETLRHWCDMSKERRKVISVVIEPGGVRSPGGSSPQLKCALKEYLARHTIPYDKNNTVP